MASNEPAQVPEQDQASQPNAVIEPISERPVANDVPYSTFPVWQKKTIVLSVSMAAVFSPMSTVGYLTPSILPLKYSGCTFGRVFILFACQKDDGVELFS